MTAEEITYSLSLKGFKPNEWTSLASSKNSFSMIGLTGDNNIYVNPTRIYFYFDITDEILYMMKVAGKPSTKNIYKDSQSVLYNDKLYYFAAHTDYVLINDAKVTDCIQFDSICAFY